MEQILSLSPRHKYTRNKRYLAVIYENYLEIEKVFSGSIQDGNFFKELNKLYAIYFYNIFYLNQY